VRSTVNWAVLGLVIEKPSYGYELLQRFEGRYGEILRVSGPSHVYAALNRLEKAHLIEPAHDGDAPAASERQPKVSYRATADGARAFRRWVGERIRDDEQRIELMGRLIAVGARRLDALGEIVDRYEHECVEAVSRMPLARREPGGERETEHEFTTRLVAEERRFALEAQLLWIEFARQELAARAARRHGAAATEPAAPEPAAVTPAPTAAPPQE
jgi:DNA-binding PadR family transcriptional regulator